MKKIIFLSLFGVCFLGGYAQYWNLTGNSGTTNTDFIGTTDNTPLVFRTNGIERMRLLSDKPFLGIGLSGADPLAPLHLWRVPPMDGTFTKSFQISSNPLMVFNPNDGFSIGCNNTKKVLMKQHENANLSIEGPMGGLTIARDGYIGFGTEQPKEKLHLEDGNLLINRKTPKVPNVPNGSLIFDVQNNNDPLSNQWGIERVDSRTDGYGLNFWKYYDEGVPHKAYQMQSVLFLSDLQNVGIGTRTPQKKLDVEGSFKAWSAELSGALIAQSANITKTLTAKKLEAETANLTSMLSAKNATIIDTLTAKTLSIKDINISGNSYIKGKLGVGTTGNLYEQMQIGDIWTFHNGGNKYIGYNATYTSSGNVRIEQGFSSFLNFNANGSILLETAGTGAAGSAIVTTNKNLILTANGDVGIGTKNPNAKLEVSGQVMATSANINGITYINGNLGVGFSNPTHKLHVVGNSFFNGNVGIGVSNPTVPLDVKGTIRAEEVKVCLSQGCDYVFEEDYELMNLSDLHTFIKTNKHLPDVAPAAEMEAEGINLSEMNATLLKKVEELTLYIILIEKRLSELESEKGGE